MDAALRRMWEFERREQADAVRATSEYRAWVDVQEAYAAAVAGLFKKKTAAELGAALDAAEELRRGVYSAWGAVEETAEWSAARWNTRAFPGVDMGVLRMRTDEAEARHRALAYGPQLKRLRESRAYRASVREEGRRVAAEAVLERQAQAKRTTKKRLAEAMGAYQAQEKAAREAADAVEKLPEFLELAEKIGTSTLWRDL